MEERKPQRTGRARMVFLLWVLIAFFYFYLASDYVRAEMRDREFQEYVQFAVQLVGSQRRTPQELRQLIMAKARELQIPLDPVSIQVSGEGQSLEVQVVYSITIEVPLLTDAAFRKEYDHAIGYVVPR